MATTINQLPGCCGIAGCRGCAWECVPDKDHDYVVSATINGIQTLVCTWCGNVTPNLSESEPWRPPSPVDDPPPGTWEPLEDAVQLLNEAMLHGNVFTRRVDGRMEYLRQEAS